MNMMLLLAIGSGGFIGAILRYSINNYVSHHYEHTLPFGILFVNLLGSLLIGIVFAIFTFTSFFSQDTKLYSFIVTGAFGALTTYSTFAMDSFMLIHSGHYGMAAINMTANVLGTVLFAGIGFMSMKYILA